MANTFKNAAKAIGNSATTGGIHAIYISNIHETNDATVDITVTDTSQSNTAFHIAKNLSVPNGAVAIFEKPINTLNKSVDDLIDQVNNLFLKHGLE